MKTYGLPVKKGDVIITSGNGNAPGAGGVISTMIVTDDRANGRVPDRGGYEVRDATPAEVRAAETAGRIHRTTG